MQDTAAGERQESRTRCDFRTGHRSDGSSYRYKSSDYGWIITDTPAITYRLREYFWDVLSDHAAISRYGMIEE